MSYEQFKVTDEAVSQSGVCAAPDKLTGTAQENKQVFDRLIRDVIKEQMNGLIAQLDADISRLDEAGGGISATAAEALSLDEGATVDEALIRLRNISQSGGIPNAEYVGMTKEAAEGLGLESSASVNDALKQMPQLFTRKYYHTFKSTDWAEDGTLTIPASVHGLTSTEGMTFRPLMLVDGIYRSDTWGALETWGSVDEDGNAILHFPSYVLPEDVEDEADEDAETESETSEENSEVENTEDSEEDATEVGGGYDGAVILQI